MERALFLAERGRGLTSPNPMVGAVIVSAAGVVVGQGAHLAAGQAHAEVVALAAAGTRAAGASLYCTLEPCCHVGRTGPCAEQIVAAGIARVVAAMQDPNPRVGGGGFRYLREHGVAIDVGDGEAEARRMNAPFLTWLGKRRPFVIAKCAVSADGFAGRRDAPVRLTGAIADRFFHRQRAEVDAIAVGAETVLVDDPLLTARLVYRRRPLTRVIVDWRLRVPHAARVFSTLSSGPVIMMVARAAADRQPETVKAFLDAGVEVDVLERRDLAEMLTRLARREVLSVLIEGGPVLQAAFLEAGLVDRVQQVRTPATLGFGVPGLSMPPATGATAGSIRETRLGDDVLIECDVHGTD